MDATPTPTLKTETLRMLARVKLAEWSAMQTTTGLQMVKNGLAADPRLTEKDRVKVRVMIEAIEDCLTNARPMERWSAAIRVLEGFAQLTLDPGRAPRAIEKLKMALQDGVCEAEDTCGQPSTPYGDGT